MMEYTILAAEHYVDLQKKVREYIAHGYTPHGGIAVVLQSGGMMYSQKEFYQAMIKTK